MADPAKSILIVEDEASIAEVFKKQLELIGGFTVEIANGGKDGVVKLESQNYDLVLLDLVMPEMDGLEVLKVMSGSDKLKVIPVVVLTNVTSDDAWQKARELGSKDIIVKTDIDPTNLISKINSVIGQKVSS